MECNTFYNINDAILDMNALREENWEAEALLDFGVQSNVRAHARKGPTLQKKGVCAQLNCLEKRFKICHILCIRKPM